MGVKVELIQNSTVTTQERARGIMKKNFIGINEVFKYFRIEPNSRQIDALLEIPFSEVKLKKLKKVSILVPDFSLSIIEILEKIGNHLNNDDSWLERSSFAEKSGEISWQLVYKKPRMVEVQRRQRLVMTTVSGELLTARLLFYTTILYYFVAGKRLLSYKDIVRTSDSDATNVVSIGPFKKREGLYINLASFNFCFGSGGVPNVHRKLIKI